MPISMPSETQGWPVAAPRRPKKTRWTRPVEDLEEILGGLATTLGRVSRMEVREGMMGAPEMVVSQYRRFCATRLFISVWLLLVEVLLGGGGGGLEKGSGTHVLVVDDDPLSVVDVDAVRCPYPAFPEDTVHPREADLFLVIFPDIDMDALRSP